MDCQGPCGRCEGAGGDDGGCSVGSLRVFVTAEPEVASDVEVVAEHVAAAEAQRRCGCDARGATSAWMMVVLGRRGRVGSRGMELGSERLRLRRVTAADVDELVALDADPAVMRYISGGAGNSREVYEAELLPRMLMWNDRPYGFFAAEWEGRFVGWFHLRPSVADAEMLELGYRLRREAWGRGLATEGARCLLGHAFDALQQPAVDACAHPDNAASIGVMIKCGMRRVGTFVHPRVPIEVVRYLVDRAGWRAQGRSQVVPR